MELRTKRNHHGQRKNGGKKKDERENLSNGLDGYDHKEQLMEYIDKETAKKSAFRYLLPNGEQSPKVVFVDAIDEIPAADVAPVRRGKWTEDRLGFYCSECGHPIDFHEKTPYCPMCGAKME